MLELELIWFCRSTPAAHAIFMHQTNTRDLFSYIYVQAVDIDDEELNPSRRDAKTMREKAVMYLDLNNIAAGSRNSAGAGCSTMLHFPVATRGHSSQHPVNSFFQGTCKLNLAVNELQVAFWLGNQMSSRGFFSCNYDLFYSVKLTFPVSRKAHHKQ
jgi:hypothetical protein